MSYVDSKYMVTSNQLPASKIFGGNCRQTGWGD